MKKKILSLCLVLCLAATAIVGGTLAYFTDSEKATNTMVIGNVQINIDEWQYDTADQKWENFVNKEFVLYPIENEQGSAIYNKSVRTYNTSSSKDDVYMRSIILIEKNDNLIANYVNEGGENDCFPGLHFNFSTNDKHTASYDGRTHHGVKQAGALADTVTFDGNEYWVVWFEEKNGEAIAWNEAMASLSGIYMDKGIKQEDLVGWGDDGVQVVAFSQAIQSEGLSHTEAMAALGEVTVNNVETWVAGAEGAIINDMPANN